MKNGELDLMNATASSWTDENLNNDFINYYKSKNFKEEFIDKGINAACYKIKTQEGRTFIRKYAINNKKRILVDNAFLSTFTHTPYLVAYDEKKECLIWRYEEEKTTTKKDEKIEIFFNYNEWYTNKNLYANFFQIPPLLQKNALQLLVQQFFFNMFDRKTDNLIFKSDRFSHIDIDRLLFREKTTADIQRLMTTFDTIIKEQPVLNKYIQAQIDKIINIDLSTFIDRYIRNCLIANVNQYEALDEFEQFVYELNNFMEHHPLITNKISEQFKDNSIYELLYNGYQEFNQKSLQNEQLQNLLKDGNRFCNGKHKFKNTEVAQWFLKKFEQQKEKWVYNEETAEKYIKVKKQEQQKFFKQQKQTFILQEQTMQKKPQSETIQNKQQIKHRKEKTIPNETHSFWWYLIPWNWCSCCNRNSVDILEIEPKTIKQQREQLADLEKLNKDKKNHSFG